MNLIGGKWKIVILYHLQDEVKRFTDLHNALPEITEATLNSQLKQLEKEGLIKKQLFGTKPPLLSEYSLTEFGRSLYPVLDAITNWGNEIALQHGKFIAKA